MGEPLFFGIDIGSVTVKLVVLDESAQILAWRYGRSHGQPRALLLAQARSVAKDLNLELDEKHRVAADS